MNFPVTSLTPLHLITVSNRWNIHPFLEPDIPADLAQSFKTTGILQPPLVLEQKDGTYELIAGRRRVRAAKEICGLSFCHCLIAPHGTTPDILLKFLLENQSLSHPFSPMEMAYFFEIGTRYLPKEELAIRYLPLLIGKKNITLVKNLALLLSLEYSVQQLVHSLFISEGMAHELIRLKSVDRLELVRLFSEFQLGGGKQKRLFSLLRDIANRKEIEISALLQFSEIKTILQHQEMNNPQKMLNLFSFLQKTVAPSLHADEELFQISIKKLKLPTNCTVQHSPAFEADSVNLTIKFDDLDHLRKTWPKLQRSLQEK